MLFFLLPLPSKKDWRYRNQDWKQDSDRERNRNCNTWYEHYLKKAKQNKPFSNTADVHCLPLRETGSAKRFSIVAVSPWLHYLGDSVSPWFHSRLPIHWSPCWSAFLSPLRSPVVPVHCEKVTKSPWHWIAGVGHRGKIVQEHCWQWPRVPAAGVSRHWISICSILLTYAQTQHWEGIWDGQPLVWGPSGHLHWSLFLCNEPKF